MARRKMPKRLFPKNMSASSVRTPRIDSSKAAAYNSQRSPATVGSRNDIEHKPNNSFTQSLPPTHFTHYGEKRYNPDDGTWNMSERGKVFERKHNMLVVEGKGLFGLYRVWQSGMRNQGVTEYYCLTLKENKEEKISFKLFFSGSEYLYVWESEGTRRISKTYIRSHDMRKEAIQRLENNKVAWPHKEDI